jgi:hypothetical protein
MVLETRAGPGSVDAWGGRVQYEDTRRLKGVLYASASDRHMTRASDFVCDDVGDAHTSPPLLESAGVTDLNKQTLLILLLWRCWEVSPKSDIRQVFKDVS